MHAPSGRISSDLPPPRAKRAPVQVSPAAWLNTSRGLSEQGAERPELKTPDLFHGFNASANVSALSTIAVEARREGLRSGVWRTRLRDGAR